MTETTYKKLALKLKGASTAELDAAANKLLFGTKTVPYTRNGLLYQRPKRARGKCRDCGKARYEGGVGLCRTCYRLRAKKKRPESIDANTYQSILDGAGFENGERVAIIRVDGD
jgi:hypothetical protein